MAHIVIIGSGLSGTLAAYEILPKLREEDRLTLVGEGPTYHFVPSNPWVAVGWRKPADIKVDLAPILARKNAEFLTSGAQKVSPAENVVLLNDGTRLSYDYLVVATGPDLAFDEIAGLGPSGFTHSICHVDHATKAYAAFEAFCASPGPIVVGAVQGASCFGPAYEFAMILDTELRRRRIRDRVAITFVTPEPYIGHLGLDGVGDTRGMLESEFRGRHIKWITNAKVQRVEPGKLLVEELDENAQAKAKHELAFSYASLIPGFRGVEAVRGIEGLTNPRGFVTVDRHQRNPAFPNVFAVGVCVAIAPVGPTPVPVGVPKTGFMIESMVTATAENIGALLRGKPAATEATWNAVCLADFGDGGVAFVAQPQIPPRNVNWASRGRWVHTAKKAFEKYFLHKIRGGVSEPFYERWALDALRLHKVRKTEQPEREHAQ